MARGTPLVITVGLTGSRISKEQTPHIPVTPGEITRSGVEAWRAGASVVHVHVRDVATGLGTQDVAVFREVVDHLRAETDAILCLTTSGIPGRNLSTGERLAPLALRPEMASFDAGSINTEAGVFVNDAAFLDAAVAAAREHGVKLELECFDTGMIVTALRYHEQGLLPAPLHFQFLHGSRYGMPATAAALAHAEQMVPAGSTWSVIGIGKAQLPMAMLALAMGGHVRVGLEDNIYYRRGELAVSNAQLVERVVRLAGELGRPVARAPEARRLLGLA
ncbi:MAG: 3-keto-5-aminohexanoate cleavage protein [Thermoleophilia bacterium]